MKKITKLTKEQEEEIPKYIEEYVRVASEPIDRSKIGGLLEKIYGEKKIYIVGESIQNTIDLIKICLEITKKKIGVYDSQLNSQLYSQLHSQLGSQLGDTKWAYYVGIWWTTWVGWYMFGKNIGVQFDEEKLQLFSDIVRNVSNITIFVGNVVFICEKPLVRWENGMIHSDQRPAIEWKDGTGFYNLDGVHFEKELWEKVISQKMTFKEIMAIEISDQRTVALKYNPQAILNEGATLVHKDNRNNELYLIEGKEINKELEEDKIWFLKMLCPTGRVFIEGVDPIEAEKNPNATAMQAILCGLTLSEYMSMELES